MPFAPMSPRVTPRYLPLRPDHLVGQDLGNPVHLVTEKSRGWAPSGANVSARFAGCTVRDSIPGGARSKGRYAVDW